MKCLKGIMAWSSKKVTRSVTQLKCLYTNAHSMGSKQEKLEATLQLESYNLITITKTWWEGPHNWNTEIDYKLFRRQRQERKSKQVSALQVKKKKKKKMD